MNERIRLLWGQAITIEDGGDYVCGELDPVKFAQLIVAECVKMCEHESNDDEYDDYDMGMWVKAESIKTAIKQHFGVEL